jgi:hypothetical protein
MKEMSNLETFSNKLSPQNFFICLEKSSIGKKSKKGQEGEISISWKRMSENH